jgi:hypothetical protein
MSTLEKELQDQNRKFEASLEASRKAAGAFEEVKKKRCALLRDFVVQVKDALNVTYGQANLRYSNVVADFSQMLV